MKARFTDEQIIAMIKEQEAGEKTADVCRRHGISLPFSSSSARSRLASQGAMPLQNSSQLPC